ncbi:RCC1 domain-containing protein [Castellaniella hirudinis]|uniref:RCC1 domain-containing protein n=1 Tax=Castellaniella hirudinis TaxID=1144617 RepID=UPI0039C106DA
MAILQMSAGAQRSVALASDGLAWGWGAFKTAYPPLPDDLPAALCAPDKAEIGHRRYAQPYPQSLNPGTPFQSVADGAVHVLGACASGGLLACRPVIAPDRGAAHQAVPAVPAGVRQLAGMQTVSLALLADGRVWSWGFQHQGQLGRPAAVGHAAPAAVPGLPPIQQLACGTTHALALDRAGAVWSWGGNQAGQLGQGGLRTATSPGRVDLPVAIRQVAAGDTHSLALDESGRLWAWGANNHGQLGHADAAYATRPVPVDTAFGLAQLAAGMFYTVALSDQGEVFAWGWNGLGQMGLPQPHSSPQAVRLPGLAHITQLAAGAGHVLATDNQTIYAWGDNRSAACGLAAEQAVVLKPNPIHLA